MGFDPLDYGTHSDIPALAAAYKNLLPSDASHFTGGLVGFLGYDAGVLPASQFGVYNKTIVYNHQTGQTQFFHYPAPGEKKITDITTLFQPFSSYFEAGNIQSTWTESDYTMAFNQIQAAIQAGGVYQVNLSQRFSVPISGNPAVFYQYLEDLSAAPFSAYLKTPAGAICCASPERVFKKTGTQLTTQQTLRVLVA